MRDAGLLRAFGDTVRLLSHAGHEVQLAHDLDRELTESIRLAAECPGVTWVAAPRGEDRPWAVLARHLRAARDYLRYQHPRYARAEKLRERAGRRVPPVLRVLAHVLSRGGYRAVEATLSAMRAAEEAIPPSRELRAFLRRQQPDVVLVSPLVDFGTHQVAYLKSARAAGIPAGLCVATWDSLTNKGLIGVLPNRVFAWNDTQKDEAVTLHSVPGDRVVVTGAPVFDHWFTWQPSRSRQEFCRMLGFDPEQPVILYLGSSGYIAPAECETAGHWVHAIRAADDPALRKASILIRPHPKNFRQWTDADLPFPSVAVWPDRAGRFEAGFNEDFFDSLFHSSVVVGINTSALIEASIVGRRAYTWRAPEFTHAQEGTLHFQHLIEVAGGVLHVADNLEEHVRQLARALVDDAEVDHSAFLEAFVRPLGLDTPAAPVLAAAVDRLAGDGGLQLGRGRLVLRAALYPWALLAWLVAGGLLAKRNRKLVKRSRRILRRILAHARRTRRKLEKTRRMAVHRGRKRLRSWRTRGALRAQEVGDLTSAWLRLAGSTVLRVLRAGVVAPLGRIVSCQPRGPAVLFTIGRSRWLVVKPFASAYGHLLMDVAMAFYVARAVNARLFLVRDDAPNSAVYSLDSDEVRVIDHAGLRGLAMRGVWSAVEACRTGAAVILVTLEAARTWVERYRCRRARDSGKKQAEIRRQRRYRTKLYGAPPARLTPREIVEAARVRRSVVDPRRASFFGLDLRREYASRPMRIDLPRRFEPAARELASAHGIDPERPIVAVHARESGYWRHDSPHDTLRNSQIETYLPAMDFLVAQGYQVVRIGDPTMAPVRRDGVVDLATSPARAGLLELWCAARAEFLIAGCSGPHSLTWLLGIPLLGANIVINLLNTYPLRPRDLYILKHVFDLRRSRPLSLTELLTQEYDRTRHDLERYRYIDNTEEEILLAVQEMVAGVRGEAGEPGPAQLEYRRLLTALTDAKRPDGRGRYSDDVARFVIPSYLGDGHVARFFAERHLSPEPSRAHETAG